MLPAIVRKDEVWLKAFLDGHLLDSQCTFFKLTMATNIQSFFKEFFMSTSCLDCGPRLVLLHLQAKVIKIY
jgi:hypothetical protein